eukprot:11813051-Alexandrium_andersonii.AAC.1
MSGACSEWQPSPLACMTSRTAPAEGATEHPYDACGPRCTVRSFFRTGAPPRGARTSGRRRRCSAMTRRGSTER